MNNSPSSTWSHRLNPLDPEQAAQLERIRQSLPPGKRSIAFFCPTKSFRNQFGNTPQLLRQSGYSAIQLYGERADDKFEKDIHSYQVSGNMVDNMDFIDAFIVPTVMDCLPNRPKKVLFNHNSFAGAGLEPPVAPEENLPENPSYDQLVEHYKHLLAFLPLYDYICISTPYVGAHFEEILSFYGKGPSENPSPYATKVVEGLYGHRMPETQAIIPCGYAPIDAILSTNPIRRSSEKIITYAPTPMIGKAEWEPFASTRNHGGQIIQALLKSFPEYKVVFKPYPNEEPSLIKACVDHVINHPRFELHLSGESHDDLYSRTSMLVTDFSSTGYTFALSYEKPVLFFSHNETNLPEIVKCGPYCMHRSDIGAVAWTLEEIPTKANALLNGGKHKSIIRLRNEFLFNPGKSDQYFCDNIDYIINDKAHPDWNYYSPKQRTPYTKYKLINPANAPLKPKATDPHLREFQIVSAPMPSGIAWLVNVLLELGIKTTHHGSEYRDNHWLPSGDGTESIHPDAYQHLRWHLPALPRHDSFAFEPELEIRWEHRLDFAREPRRTILFTRDGRDAVYSEYRRHHEKTKSFEEFLLKTDEWPDHFPGLFQLPPAESWALFNLYWLEMAKIAPLKVVRFEDTKTDPVKVVQEVLEFLGVQRSVHTIEEANTNSSFEKSKHQEQCAADLSDELDRKNHRKGKAYEWREHFSAVHASAFLGIANEALEQLNYEPVAPIQVNCLDETPLFSENDIKIRQTIKSGDLPHACQLLLSQAMLAKDKSQQLSILAERTATDWIHGIFGTDCNCSRPANTARLLFAKILRRHSDKAPVRELITHNVDLESAIVLCEYRGYLLVQAGRAFCALSPSLGPDFRLCDHNPEAISLLSEQGKCIIVSDESRLRPAVDTQINSALQNAVQYAETGDQANALNTLNACITLTGAKDSETMKIADFLMNSKKRSPYQKDAIN